MRTTKIVLTACALFLMAAGGCDVLNQEPQSQISENAAFTNAKAAEAALTGLYNEVQNTYSDNIQVMSAVSSDVAQSIGTWDHWREMDTYQVVASGNVENSDTYGYLYRTINHANNLIAYVPDIKDMSADEKDDVRGQAFFMRGFAYFDLARIYAGIPGEVGTMGVAIVTEPTQGIDEGSYPSRSSMDATWTQVKDDLEKALSLLPESHGNDYDDRARVTKATARALLSRYYLYMKDYQQSADYATQVIDDGRFELVDDYASIFNTDFTREAIFELDYSVSDPNDHANWYLPPTKGGRGDLAAHTEFRNEVASRPNDQRNLFDYEPQQQIWYPTKYSKTSNNNDQHILRIAEMYLNRAESRAHLDQLTGNNGALADLNRIRNRAGLADTTGTGVDTQSEVIDAILKERKIELAFEGHRWFDLVRTGRAMQVLSSVPRTNSPGAPASLTEPGRQIFPIPQDEIDTNPNIEQNEAYK